MKALRCTALMIVALSLLFTACNGPSPAQKETQLPAEIAATITPQPTETPSPIPQIAVLVHQPDFDQRQIDEARIVLEELAASAGMQVEVRSSIQPSDVTEQWKLVFLLSSPANLEEIVTTNPQTQFVAVSPVDYQPYGNLTIIRPRPSHQAFIAGYTTILAATDWRSAAILPSDEPDGLTIWEAFLNGAHYFCGRCNSIYSPIVSFPLTATLPSNSDITAWQAAVDEMQFSYIYAIYVAPEIASPDLLYSLASEGIILVGGQTPPDEVRPLYAATVRYDAPSTLRELWPTVIAGQGGITVNTLIQVTDVNPELLSPGRQRLIQETMQLLKDGWVSPLSPAMQ